MAKTIGIDLGTTNTAVAAMMDGRPKILEDDKGYKVLPSCVSSKGSGKFIVGQIAKNLVLSAPDRTVFAVKRLIGRRFDSPEVVAMRQRVSYGIEPADDGGVKVRLGDTLMTPIEVSAIILQVARQIAEKQLGDTVEEAVVTVPAYFSHAQREATFQAAQLAGLRCERLLNEPTAAALAYGFRKDIDKTIMVFDLGGGTLDVCVLRLSSGVYEILATNGDTFLGGEDFDFRLLEHLADHFQALHGVDLRKDRTAVQRLKDAAERAKCELSFTDRTTVLVPRVLENQNLELVVSRPTLEALVEDLVSRSTEVVRQTVNEAGLGLGQIDDVLMVGGQARMPKVRDALSALFGKEPNRSIHPEEVVAIGAAVHASSLVDSSFSAPILLDITPFDLGINTVGGLFTPIISKNSKIPTSRTRTFVTVHDNQDQVRVVVRQGDSGRSEENEFLGEFIMQGLTPAPRMDTKVEVTFRLDVNGMLHVSATEQGKKEKCQITIRNYARYVKAITETGDKSIKPEIVESNLAKAPESASASAETPSALYDTIPSDALVPEPAGADSGEKKSRFAAVLDRLRRKPARTPAQSEPVALDHEPLAQVKDIQLLTPTELAESADPDPEFHSELRIDLSSVRPDPVDLSSDDLQTLDQEAIEEIRSLGLGGEEPPVVGMADGGSRSSYKRPSEPPTPANSSWIRKLAMPEPPESDFGGPTPAELFGAPPFPDPGQASPSGAPSVSARHGSLSPEPWVANRPDRTDPEFASHLQGLMSSPPPEEPRRAKKPARLKMKYATDDALLKEWKDHLSQGAIFVRASKPLVVGRQCLIEIDAPSLHSRLSIEGVVTWSSAGLTEGLLGEEPGMRVEFDLDDRMRAEIETILDRAMG